MSDTTLADPAEVLAFDPDAVEATIAALKAQDRTLAAFLLRVGLETRRELASGRAQLARDKLEHGLAVALEIARGGPLA